MSKGSIVAMAKQKKGERRQINNESSSHRGECRGPPNATITNWRRFDDDGDDDDDDRKIKAPAVHRKLHRTM